jgi:hypothetical protein
MPPLASTTCTYKVYIDIKPEMVSVVNIRFLDGHTLASQNTRRMSNARGKSNGIMESVLGSWTRNLMTNYTNQFLELKLSNTEPT